MRKGKTYIWAAALLVAVVALAGVAAACGSSSSSSSTASASSAASSPMDIATKILGHAPTGLAAKIVGAGQVIVANDANYPPQSSIDKSTGKMVGFDVDTALKMGQLLGLKVVFKNPAWETIPAGLQQGRYDVSIGSMTITPERQKVLDFTDPYYYTSGQVFVKKGGTQITGPQDLNGKKVGVGAATTYYDYLKKNTKADVKTYQTDADAFPDLANGNLDFVMTAGPTGQQAILSGQPFEFSGKPLYYEDLAFAIKQGEPDWLALLNYSVQTMHQDGSLTAMSKKWYNGMDLTVKQ
ncbi:MAG TPA: transporter substrate-binding domain-containing protein [Thermoleophilia bacterium]|nr:transporter substrate-binding domain-containing protein [Thermoleophilia bacterium]